MTFLNRDADYFSLFALPQRFAVDVALLGERYRELQREFHPDRFAHADERQQRLAVQYSAQLNDGYATLKSPLKRAIYLLQLRGIETTQQNPRALGAAFLMQQMEWRERLESIQAITAVEEALDELEALNDEVVRLRRASEQAFVTCLESDAAEALERATEKVRELQFIEKMQFEIEQLEERLTDD